MSDIKIGIILMAAGEGKRYGSNKLLDIIKGRRLFEHTLEAVKNIDADKVIVTGYSEIGEYAGELGIPVVINDRPEEGISRTIRLGTEKLKYCDALIFSVCDQPGVSEETFTRLIEGYRASGLGLASMGQTDGTLGNPCIFHKKYFDELMELTGDTGGKKVIKKHMDDLRIIPAETSELEDIDYRTDAR